LSDPRRRPTAGAAAANRVGAGRRQRHQPTRKPEPPAQGGAGRRPRRE